MQIHLTLQKLGRLKKNNVYQCLTFTKSQQAKTHPKSQNIRNLWAPFCGLCFCWCFWSCQGFRGQPSTDIRKEVLPVVCLQLVCSTNWNMGGVWICLNMTTELAIDDYRCMLFTWSMLAHVVYAQNPLQHSLSGLFPSSLSIARFNTFAQSKPLWTSSMPVYCRWCRSLKGDGLKTAKINGDSDVSDGGSHGDFGRASGRHRASDLKQDFWYNMWRDQWSTS